MYLCGYSLDNLSLMALTISTGFVVDDAIVVIENISRYREQGMAPFEAAVRGAREIGFTVVSISISLVAVFIPILLMGGIVGRLFREFAVTLSTAIAVSMVVSLTTTPMMCAKLLRPEARRAARTVLSARASESSTARWLHTRSALSWVLRHSRLTLAIALATLGLSVYLFSVIPKGFFPQQDTGRLMGAIQADQDTSFQSMRDRLTAIRRHHQGRSGRRSRDRICRRQCRQHQHGAHVHRAQAAGPAQAQRRPGDRAAAQKDCRISPVRRSISRPCRTCGSAAARATRSISTRCKDPTCRN